MTAPIADLIAAVHAAGGSIGRCRNEIKLTAAAPLPDDLVAQIRARKPELIAHLAEDRPKFSRPNGFQGCFWPISNGSCGNLAETLDFRSAGAILLIRQPISGRGRARCLDDDGIASMDEIRQAQNTDPLFELVFVQP